MILQENRIGTVSGRLAVLAIAMIVELFDHDITAAGGAEAAEASFREPMVSAELSQPMRHHAASVWALDQIAPRFCVSRTIDLRPWHISARQNRAELLSRFQGNRVATTRHIVPAIERVVLTDEVSFELVQVLWPQSNAQDLELEIRDAVLPHG